MLMTGGAYASLAGVMASFVYVLMVGTEVKRRRVELNDREDILGKGISNLLELIPIGAKITILEDFDSFSARLEERLGEFYPDASLGPIHIDGL